MSCTPNRERSSVKGKALDYTLNCYIRSFRALPAPPLFPARPCTVRGSNNVYPVCCFSYVGPVVGEEGFAPSYERGFLHPAPASIPRPFFTRSRACTPAGNLAVPLALRVRSAFAFSQERFFLRRVKLRDGGGGGEGGPRPLSRLVIAFTCSAGDIVRVRSDPACESRVESRARSRFALCLRFCMNRAPCDEILVGCDA